MSYHQPNRAPLGCREPRCVHLVESNAKGEPNDRCERRKPQHDGCAWKETAEDLRVRAEREGRL